MKGLTEVYVSNIEPNGDVYIQIRSPGYERLMSLLSDLEVSMDQELQKKVNPTSLDDPELIYFMKHKNEQWYRVKIKEWAPNKVYVQLYFVDYGNCDIVKVCDTHMLPLNDLSDTAGQFPGQAVRVQMDIDKIPKDFQIRAKEMMPKDQPVLIKVSKKILIDGKYAIKGRFFKRTSPNRDLVSICDCINFETEK